MREKLIEVLMRDYKNLGFFERKDFENEDAFYNLGCLLDFLLIDAPENEKVKDFLFTISRDLGLDEEVYRYQKKQREKVVKEAYSLGYKAAKLEV